MNEDQTASTTLEQTAREAMTQRDAGELEQRCNAMNETLDGVTHLRSQLIELVGRLDSPPTGTNAESVPRPVRSGLLGQLTDIQQRLDEELKAIHDLMSTLNRLI